jgi:hypothetical protein
MLLDTTINDLATAIAACSAIAAAFSAYFSFRSSRTAENVAATTLVQRYRDQYASDQMLTDLRNLRAWYDKFGSKFAETWQEKLKQNDKQARIVDCSRRRVSSFFFAILDLHDARLVPKRIEKLLADFDGFDLLYSVVEPLERELNPKYDKIRFDRLRTLRPPQVLGQHIAIDPVIRDSDAA